MNQFINWKSITALLTVASLLIPVWIWRSDVNSKSLQFRVISLVGLQPETATSISGLQISVDGLLLESPFLTVLELSNSGDRPITTSDFEVPLELRAQEGATIVKASVASVSPNDVKAIVTTKAGYVELKPMLLNPRDSVTISVLSSGLQPTYTASSRIVGIASVPVISVMSDTGTWLGTALLFIGSVFLLATFSIVSDSLTKKNFTLRKRAAVIVAAVSCFSGFYFFIEFLNRVGIQDFFLLIAAFGPLIFITSIVSVYLNWPAQSSPNISN